MTERHDPETSEVFETKMPPAIAAAIVAVMKEAKQLGYDENNAYSKYKYVSADKFFATFGPSMAKAGLMILMDEESVEIKMGQSQESGKQTGWLHTRYAFTFAHESGATYGPVRRTVIVPAVGAQAFGSAQTYLLKQFLRATFLVPTGEKDEVDQQPSDVPLPTGGNATRPGSPEMKAQQSQVDIEYARGAFSAIRQQVAQSTSVEDVDAVMAASTKQLEDIKRIAGEPHWQKLIDSAKARKDMLGPEEEPRP